MKISIVIPVYNTQAKYLRQAVESVLFQTYTKWKLIIVDDGSTRPETLNELRAIEEKFERRSSPVDIVIIRQKNQKISGALNTGIRNMHYKSFWWAGLASDDRWYREKLERQVEFIENHPNARVLYTDWEFINADGKTIKEYIEPEFTDRKEAQKYIIDKYFGNWSCMMIHWTVFEKVGLFNENYPVREDYEMNIRILNHYMMYKVPGIWVQYRLHNEQITCSEDLGTHSITSKKYCQTAKELAKQLYEKR